ncbi:RES domain-containing protein [Mesorhizobium sp. LCM 4576]|uniref:RES domain-containing protein n=1 Tax=Mesorhizobium sp. LCM 4576 TaxID=1848289 RepID=UPI001FCE0E0B|nr:RES domain-containing protein [Mesorhizobium sp. LCM 4576]
MGAPPKRRSSHGRANPAGIPYLYLGSLPETAAAEIRPHTGEVACVADFTIPDLRPWVCPIRASSYHLSS